MLKNHLKRIVLGALLGIIAGVLYWKLAPPVFDGQAIVYINAVDARSGASDMDPNVQGILQLGNTQNVISEIDILRGEPTFKQALHNVASQKLDTNLDTYDSEQRLYTMYDVEADRDSKVASIDVKAYNANEAADIANAIADVYNTTRKATNEDSFKNAEDYLDNQITATNSELHTVEVALAKFKRENGLINPGSDEATLAARRDKLQGDLQQDQLAVASLTRQLTEERAQLQTVAKVYKPSRTLSVSPAVESLRTAIIQAQEGRTALLLHYVPNSDKVKNADVEISRLNAQLKVAQREGGGVVENASTEQVDPIYQKLKEDVSNNEITLAQAQTGIGQITQQLSEANNQANSYPQKEMQQAQLARDRQVYESDYMRLKQEKVQIDLRKNSETTQVAKVYDAVPNPKPVSPLPAKTIPTGLAIGACLALLLSLAREALRTTVRTSSELAGVLGLPVTATVPALKPRVAEKRLRTLAEPSFIPMESFRFMASAAALMPPETRGRKVLFTSVGGNVGCSTSASEFAIATARMGVKTILMDCDLAHATVSKAFGVSGKPGLRDVLNHTLLPSGETQLFLPTEHKNLFVFPAGSAEGLGIADVPSSQLAAVLESIEPHAQLIVIDCPPFDVLADAARFIPHVEETCLVVSAQKTNLQSIMITEKLLLRAGAQTISVVLTHAAGNEEAFSRRYHSYYHRKAS